jgi:hypothetical protein
MATAAGDDFGCVEVGNEAGVIVAVGLLVLTSDTAGSLDFTACSSAPPPPGWYALRIENEIAGAVLSLVGPSDPGRMTVRLDEPYTEGQGP